MAGHEYIGVRPRMWRVVAAAMTVLALGGCARTSQSGEAATDDDDVVSMAGEVIFERDTHGSIFHCSSSRERGNDGFT